MPDLDDLDHFTQGLPPVHPLPPTEIRRRGDRLRRRNTALVAAGGVLAAAIAIGTPVVALSGGDGSSDIQPAPSPTRTEDPRTWLTQIPAGFPLGDGMGAEGDPVTVGTQRGEVVFDGIGICGQEAWSPESPVASTDALGAVWSDGIEGGEQRTLALYPSDADARAALAAMRDLVTGCPDPKPGKDFIRPMLQESGAGEGTLAYVDQYGDATGPTGEGNAFVVTRVGNALLLAKTYFGGAGDPGVRQQTVDLVTSRARGVVEQMCVFAADPCG